MAILRKVKDKIKKIAGARKKSAVNAFKALGKAPAKKVSKVVVKELKRKPIAALPKEELLGVRETVIEKTKFSHPETARPRKTMPRELPMHYGQDRMILQLRDPWWLHTYWEVRNDTIERIKRELNDAFYKAKYILRVYDVSNISFNGRNSHRHFDIEINEYANSWYINAAGPGRSWCVDFGLLLSDGRFVMILRSNTVSSPLDGPSWITDEEWMIPEEMFARLYGMGFGLGQSSPVGKAWQERVKHALFSGVLASPGMASMASPVKRIPKDRKFWLVVDCELIVYGATEPDAKVTVQDREIKLRPDGTFSLRFALPNGKQVIPVKAVSSDEIEERTITPIVSRETKSHNIYKDDVAIRKNFSPLKKPIREEAKV